jgi:uncharacterized protein
VTKAAIFHLAFPVTSLAASLDFYGRCFGATTGRRSEAWCDVVLFGHQLTLHERPDQVAPRAQRGVRHFGAILAWESFEAVRARIDALGLAPMPVHALRDAGLPTEHAKLLLDDPDGYLIELKAYRSLATVATALG